MSRSLSDAQSAWLVAEREIGSKLRSKAFVISSLIMILLTVGVVVFIGISASNSSGTKIAVTPDATSQVEGIDGLEVRDVADRAAAEKLVTDGDVEAAVIGDPESPLGIAVLAESSPPTQLLLSLGQLPKVELLDPDATAGFVAYFVAIGFGLVFLLAAQTFGATIAQSVVEEKQTRVVELLLSTMRTRALLAGKVIGNTVLAMGQILILAAIAVVGLTVTGQTAVLAGLGAPIAWFAVFFLLGFILLASLFAAAAAMVSRQEDIGSTTTPLMLIVIAPYFLVIFFNDNPLVMGILSYIPFSAPVAMPVRLFLGDAQWWEPVLALGILAATCVAAILVGAKIYENSILRMGARVKLTEALASR